MMDEWVPFGLSQDDAKQYKVLVDGVPKPLREPIISWLRNILSDKSYPELVRTDRSQYLEMLTSVPIGTSVEFYRWSEYTQVLRNLDGQSLLKVTDAALSTRWISARTEELDEALKICRSKWMTGTRMGKPGLVAREPEGVQDMVEGTIVSSGTSGQILARAWSKVHAFDPDHPGAYSDAVRAVEAAAQPLIEPNNTEATLGGMAARMRREGDWRLPLREHEHSPTAEMLVHMMRSLYRGHVDRHGKNDYRDVTQEEARAGVALAATLVAWFASGAVQRRDNG